MQKVKIGIDLNEIIRATWLNFDRYYSSEFYEEGKEIEPNYCLDFFKGYKWDDIEETSNELNEDLPDNIHPDEYKIDKETGEAPVDHHAFRKKTVAMKGKEVYNRFMYQEYLFEIFGASGPMYKDLPVHLEKFYYKYKDAVDFTIYSKENWFSIPPTLFFLSKVIPRFRNYKFVEKNEEIWDSFDVIITTDPEMMVDIPKDKGVIKMKRPYNEKEPTDDNVIIEALQVWELYDNKEFEELVGYQPPEEEKEEVSEEELNDLEKLVQKTREYKENFLKDQQERQAKLNQRIKKLSEESEEVDDVKDSGFIMNESEVSKEDLFEGVQEITDDEIDQMLKNAGEIIEDQINKNKEEDENEE